MRCYERFICGSQKQTYQDQVLNEIGDATVSDDEEAGDGTGDSSLVSVVSRSGRSLFAIGGC